MPDCNRIAILTLSIVRKKDGFGLSAVERSSGRDKGRSFRLPPLRSMPHKEALQAAHRLAIGYARDGIAERVLVLDEVGKPNGVPHAHVETAQPLPSATHTQRSMRIDVDHEKSGWRIQNYGHRGGSLGIDEVVPGGRSAALKRAEEIALGAIGSKSFQKVTVRLNGELEATYEAKA